MENQITTNIYITGEESDLRNVRIFLAGLPIADEGHLKLSDVAKELGLEDNILCEGYIEGLGIRNWTDCIGFDTETPNQPPRQLLDALCGKFPTLKYYYWAQIGDENITNDRGEKFFQLPKISVDLFYGDMEDSEEFETPAEALTWINEQTSQNFRTEKDVEKFFHALRDDGTLNFCRIVHTRFID
ncbi:MAG: hypothetical protein HDS78_03320 [Bacteroidales bacterium]|nr:hypothetical protein [Bacteroidales bacterium]